MTAISLREAAKNAKNEGHEKKEAIIELFAEKSDILDAMLFDGIDGSAVKFDQEANLGDVAFRGVNEAYTPGAGKVTPQTEALYILGGEVDVDRFIVQTQGTKARTRYESMKVKKMAEVGTTKILKGDNSSEAREFDGFQTRLPVTASNDHIVHNDTTSGGGALSLAKLDEAMDAVDSPTHLIMSRAMRRKFTAAKRGDTSGLMSNVNILAEDAGRQIVTYNELPILTGYGAGKSPAILGFVEAFNGGGAAAGTSIYIVNFSPEGVTGIANGGLMVDDLGFLETEPKFRTRIEWYLGLAVWTPFAISRLTSITDAAIAA